MRLSARRLPLALATLAVATIGTLSSQPAACAAEGQISARQGAYVPNSRWGRENLAQQAVERTEEAGRQQIPQRWASHVPASRWGRPAGANAPRGFLRYPVGLRTCR